MMKIAIIIALLVQRQKGYDVKALGFSENGYMEDSVFGKAFNAKTEWFPADTNKQKMFDILASQGESAYGDLGLTWKYGGGHSVFWKNENGKTHIYDGQSGMELTDSFIFDDGDDGWVEYGFSQCGRLDNCEPTEYALAVVEKNR